MGCSGGCSHTLYIEWQVEEEERRLFELDVVVVLITWYLQLLQSIKAYTIMYVQLISILVIT